MIATKKVVAWCGHTVLTTQTMKKKRPKKKKRIILRVDMANANRQAFDEAARSLAMPTGTWLKMLGQREIKKMRREERASAP